MKPFLCVVLLICNIGFQSSVNAQDYHITIISNRIKLTINSTTETNLVGYWVGLYKIQTNRVDSIDWRWLWCAAKNNVIFSVNAEDGAKYGITIRGQEIFFKTIGGMVFDEPNLIIDKFGEYVIISWAELIINRQLMINSNVTGMYQEIKDLISRSNGIATVKHKMSNNIEFFKLK